MADVKVLVITGSVCVGKSSVAEAVSNHLGKQSPHALIEMDYFRWMTIKTPGDRFNAQIGITNLESVAGNYKGVGVKNFIISDVVENEQDIRRISESIGDAEVTVVVLTASPGVLRERCENREISQARKKWLHKRTNELLEVMSNAKFAGLVIDTDQKSIQQTSKEIVEFWNPI